MGGEMVAPSPVGITQPDNTTPSPKANFQENAVASVNSGYVQDQSQNWPQISNVSSVHVAVAQPNVAHLIVYQIQKPAPVPDELGFSIFMTMCCCFFLGIPAIILSSQANSLKHTDPLRAISKVKAARALNITSLLIGIIVMIIFIAVFIVRITNSP